MERKGADSDYSFKIVIVGDSGVGKTNLLTRFTRDIFSLNLRNTVGFNSDQKIVNIEGKAIRAEIWDTAGQERYRSMSPSFYRGAVGALIVYDITNLETFNNLTKWVNELKNNADDIIAKLIIGNKSDKPERKITVEAATNFANKHQCGLIETSALESSNVEKAFETLLKQIVQTVIKSPENLGDKYLGPIKSKKIERTLSDSDSTNKKCLCCS